MQLLTFLYGLFIIIWYFKLVKYLLIWDLWIHYFLSFYPKQSQKHTDIRNKNISVVFVVTVIYKIRPFLI